MERTLSCLSGVSVLGPRGLKVAGRKVSGGCLPAGRQPEDLASTLIVRCPLKGDFALTRDTLKGDFALTQGA